MFACTRRVGGARFSPEAPRQPRGTCSSAARHLRRPEEHDELLERRPHSRPELGLALTETTIADRLKAAGYDTGLVGKWHLGLGSDARTDYTKPLQAAPTDVGFDYYFGIPASLDMPPYLYFENNRVLEQPTSSTPGSTDRGAFWRAGDMTPGFDFAQVVPTVTEKAVSIIKERAAKPSQPFSNPGRRHRAGRPSGVGVDRCRRCRRHASHPQSCGKAVGRRS